ncbi:TPA: GIY-YIG nuclease family protein, partial [Enterobacter cancerogenus]|nr:GIY-YIG nuclease family protein [Enterobacter cancerogenus]HDR2164454.1 GIY-YIG nuclease family protein [Enterobacter cancerogenus]HDR2267380.1 GIY-YIG nuclease family protein [Enterobacter cancerogenus]
DPYSRCQEINKSSTGDFIWAVAHFIPVDDCHRFERLIHLKLDPLRQKRREFFNLNVDDAYKAIVSILDVQDDIKIIDSVEREPKRAPERKSKTIFRRESAEYADLLQTFCDVLGVKGRAFGQLNKPFFGMSDGNEGVQWNITIFPETNTVRIGVNLEGVRYKDWPISRLIQSEVISARLPNLVTELESSENIHLTFARDAWQAASRPEIKEKYIGGKSFPLNELTPEVWGNILTEALECLSREHGYKKRNVQNVTLVKKNGEEVTRSMPISPHLTIWSQCVIDDNAEEAIRHKLNQLQDIYRWMSQLN